MSARLDIRSKTIEQIERDYMSNYTCIIDLNKKLHELEDTIRNQQTRITTLRDSLKYKQRRIEELELQVRKDTNTEILKEIYGVKQ